MIGKVIIGKSFAGCIAYNLERPEADLLEACGVRDTSIKDMISDFNMQRKLNPNLGQAVGHIVLSWSAEDKSKLSPVIMVERAREYMEKMKIKDTQYVIVQHTDRPHPHLHLIYNRVANNGRTITDRYQKVNNAKVCKEITLRYGYHLSEGKAAVNRHRLRGADRAKYEMNDTIQAAVRLAKSFPHLETMLGQQGMQVHYKYLGESDTVHGISFSKGAIRLKGSEIDRSLSYGKIRLQIDSNMRNLPKEQWSVGKGERPLSDMRFNATRDILIDNSPSLVPELLRSEQTENSEILPGWQKRKRKRKKGRRI
ncbi:relaxase/mobilization nuclease domain-containing protein [Arcticibacter tournemirensis]